MAEKLTLKSIDAKVAILLNSLEEAHTKIEALEAKIVELKPRDRGPSSTRKMTEDDARRIVLGDLKNESHKVAATTLGLSYAQVYSCRGGYTFKEIIKEKIETK